jgi:MFS family permease
MSEPEKVEKSGQKSVVKTMFFTMFIDLIGFSIIFPLFPGMLRYYQAQADDSPLFQRFYEFIEGFAHLAGTENMEWGILVLFGGILASLYSLLQFFFAPIFGSLSDRIGRRPIILFSLCGIFVSYVMWIFAHQFIFLVLARILGGMMSANISIATAVMADVTPTKDRSKGMAVIGIAFGLGFIVGPALGGASAMIDLTVYWPHLIQYGLNPFSMPAIIAAVLTLINLAYVTRCLPETRPPSSKLVRNARSLNPLRILDTRAYPGVFTASCINFLFLFAFSGMEFSLAFLTVEHLNYGPGQNAAMFVFVGLVMAFVQGGYVRRASHRVGVKKMASHGLGVLVPALAMIGAVAFYPGTALLYGGLFLLALGGAQATPCLTALVSLYTPYEEQGRIMGIFRSFGALARAGGPLLACILYFRIGAGVTYYLSAVFLLLPLLLMAVLPAPLGERNKS